MNRQVEVSELINKSFVEFTKNISKDDKLAFYKAILDGNKESENVILNKYNYKIVTPIENSMSDEDAERLANSLLKDDSGTYKEVNKILESYQKEYWSNAGRMNKLPLEQHEKILNHARDLQISFDSKNNVSAILYAVCGENAATILKSAIIADLIGCLDLRNDLISLFNSMITNAHNSKAMDILKKKMIISEDRRLAKKGKTNRHHTEALKIAGDTWDTYPNASLAGVAEEVYSYLHGRYNGVPSADTVKKWLRDSGLNPDYKTKNRQFKLVMPVKGEN